MKHRYDWSKLDAGWSVNVSANTIRCGEEVMFISQAESYSGLGFFGQNARAQLGKCRVVDNTALFEAMDKMAAEVPAEEWARIPTYESGSMIAAYGAPPPPVDWQVPRVEPLDGWVISRHDPTLFEQEASQPWRRGPLASWTLVNISCHDGRLTVVMKRGRGELVDETGPDDETLWKRLAAKVVDLDKAKAKAAAEAKEKGT